ncbi:ABC transporter ATP-binding protein [Raineyella fluvialis]|uniref:ATP-binding cassette domain-containing protein n=1 Tax=Raineyella fluvialis TaxID=2662261 RepID=A0A5Q2FCU4_9ACTN|nr:ABC transporter ATP-binding protein [Raineyella fluvialis]QGF24752.1 ATP-binding cassette domain-containing protein [Raineyella fluvialis]
MLEISHLTHRFGSTLAVDDLTLTVPAGRITGFIGHNGAGKSTTLRAAAGILPFNAGAIAVDGHDVRTDPIAAKRASAFLPDNPDLYDFMTGLDFLAFIADLYRIPRAERRDRIGFYAEAYDMTGNLGGVIGGYSHGMKQKLALISAFLRRPRLLLLDEPFVGLDPLASHTLKEHLRALCRDGGAVLFSTHVLEVAQTLCDDIAIIRQGRLVVSGPTATVTRDASLEDVFLELQENAR